MPATIPIPERNDVLFIRRMPRDVKSAFKSYCALHHVSMTDAIVSMMEMLALGEFDGSIRRTILSKSRKRKAQEVEETH